MNIFFRADDIGWDHGPFLRLAGLFALEGLKLNAAAIPLACRHAGARIALAPFRGRVEVHSHGLTHLDHESAGKKCEFGESRGEDEVLRDLVLSRRTLERLFRGLYFPAFVPPWNRFSARFLPLLPRAGFRCLSRDGRLRADVPGLAELNVGIDLHTSRAPGPATPEALLSAVAEAAARAPAVGIMLHHAKMGDADFDFLADFLALIKDRGARTFFLSELAGAA